ncbi:hypothetical protein L596_021444 [Steinernema carpocapsae]|uniref:Uncharacterized protein n=1 Tax=Steinernema carpocapsae TaxID=34508 RepID=A0A4U5MJL2_STECR|nr:hypothetical protein L596_021444 [Steinernema carpocapsae]
MQAEKAFKAFLAQNDTADFPCKNRGLFKQAYRLFTVLAFRNVVFGEDEIVNPAQMCELWIDDRGANHFRPTHPFQ